jgi:hypothetical protein
LSAGLKFTAATGAVLSQGAALDTPDTALASVVNLTVSWVTFSTVFEPTLSDKLLFAAWSALQNQRYLYVCWDTDVSAKTPGSNTSAGAVARDGDYNGSCFVYNTAELAAFVMGMFASVGYGRPAGRITAKFRSLSALTVSAANTTDYNALITNGYSAYCEFAGPGDTYRYFADGGMPGVWRWIDSYINQIWMNTSIQSAIQQLLINVGAAPYTPASYNALRSTISEPLDVARTFGYISRGVELDATQREQINLTTGDNGAADVIFTTGYYISIIDPGATVRAARGTPIVNIYYADGGAIHEISIASIGAQ